MNRKPVVDVAIIGAGPGGLAAAHALLRLGLSVKVFERAREMRLIGAALGLFPNAYKALEAIDPELCLQVLNVSVEPTEQILQNSNGDILFQGLPPFSGLKAKYGVAKSRVLTEFGGWPEPVEEIVQATDASRIVERGICDRLPVKHWSQGRVTLLGDAAHPMRPTLGQGTGMAFEDAYELSACRESGLNPEEALKKYETERIPRSSIIQERAVAAGERAYKDDRAQQLAKAAKNWTPDEFDDWLYNRHYRH